MRAGLGIAFALAACSSKKPVSEESKPAPPKPASPASLEVSERRATVQIDKQPGPKRFQGVFLVFPDGKRWVIDYRARTLWTWFADREVIVTGGCYEPFGEAVQMPHFRVDTMRAVKTEFGRHPYLSIGPERLLRGKVVSVAAPAGSKLEGSSRELFSVESGGSYAMLGDDVPKPSSGVVRVRARELEPDMSHHARQGGPDLWIVDVNAADYEPDPATSPRDIPCE